MSRKVELKVKLVDGYLLGLREDDPRTFYDRAGGNLWSDEVQQMIIGDISFHVGFDGRGEGRRALGAKMLIGPSTEENGFNIGVFHNEIYHGSALCPIRIGNGICVGDIRSSIIPERTNEVDEMVSIDGTQGVIAFPMSGTERTIVLSYLPIRE
jgi:hypothetical protein